MNIDVKETPNKFKPFTITIKIETEKEAQLFCGIFHRERDLAAQGQHEERKKITDSMLQNIQNVWQIFKNIK